MHKTHLEAIQTVQKLSYLLSKEDTDRIEVVVCPPFTALRAVQTIIEADRLPFALGAQDVHWEDRGAFTGVVSRQVREDASKVGPDQAARLVIAYEPVWAIGTGKACSPEDAGEAVRAIRDVLESMYSTDVAESVRVQYGGSVTAGNIREFMAVPEIDGALVGGASLDPEEFALIVKH